MTSDPLNASEKYENHNYNKDKAHASRRHIAPFPAVRPSWQRAKERQDQKDYQDRSKHCLLLFK